MYLFWPKKTYQVLELATYYVFEAVYMLIYHEQTNTYKLLIFKTGDLNGTDG